MARIGPALDVIAAATTRDERARGRAAAWRRRADGAPSRSNRGTGRHLPTGAIIILNTRNRNSALPTRRLGSQLFDAVQRGTCSSTLLHPAIRPRETRVRLSPSRG